MAEARAGQPPLVTWVLVLGDFGRSPRMQYHTQSLANQANSIVHVIAYGGSSPLQSLLDADNVFINTLPEVPPAILRLPGLLRLVLKVLHQLLTLMWIMLVKLPAPANILMQCPPAIPSLVIAYLAAKRHGASLVVDWHNLGFTIMALKHARTGALVSLARRHEFAWGRRAAKGFCVTRAMQGELRRQGIAATVLYDRPPLQFQRSGVSTAHELLVRLAPSLAGGTGVDDFAAAQAPSWGPSRSIATQSSSSLAEPTAAAWRPDRPAILISSTSWTPDEDFGILLEALILYEQTLTQQSGSGVPQTSPDLQPTTSEHTPGPDPRLPQLLVLITGRGPQREMYLERVRRLQMKHVAVRSLWLEPQDYPKLLGAADLGVSLHASSSGLDLPMKVVDMFGCGLPVCALAYSCIHELVADGETGLLFSSPQQLHSQLKALFAGFPTCVSKQLQHMQQQVASQEQGLRWESNWQEVAWPMLKQR